MSSSSQNPEPTSAKRIVMDVSKDGWTGGIQLGISELDENDGGHGYRIGGPKYNGSSKRLLTCELDQRDADEIRQFLDAKFPTRTDPQSVALPAAPRTERSYWKAIADALNAAESAGMPVGIDLDGTLTDHNAWSVIWDRDAKQWALAGYDAEGGAS